MRLCIRLLLLCGALAMSGVSEYRVSAQAPAIAQALHIQATSAEELRTWDTYVTQLERAGALRVRTSGRDPDLPSRLVERLDQFHQGVRIWGADIVRDSERGIPLSMFGVLAPDLSLSIEPSLSSTAAVQALTRSGGSGAALLGTPELVVLPLDSGDYRLAYTAVVAAEVSEVDRVFVDAQTGLELMRYSEIQTQSAVGTGRGVLGGNKKLSVLQQGGTYVASDSHRPPTLLTFDMRGNLGRFKEVVTGRAGVSSLDLASDTDNTWTDPAVVDAHAHAGMTYDYYYKRFNRNGLDNRNRPIYVYTNALSQQGALSVSSADFLSLVINAFWCGPCANGSGVMYFGNGIPAGYQTNGKNWTYLAGALDVVAHELTHAVTDSSSDLIYRNESGALNEAFSDMMGKSVEFFFHAAGGGVGQADYVIGKDVVRGLFAGVPHGIRSMENPGLYGDPDHYSKRYVGPNDNGGVHINSGIANQAFYLAIEGGTNRTSRIVVRGVGAANREQIEKVFYRAFTVLMPQNSTFVTARAATTQAARDLYGTGGAVEQAVDLAWSAVGVPDSRSIGTFSGSVPANGTTSYAFLMNITGVYTVNLRGNDPGVDLDLYLVPNTAECSRLPAPASCVFAKSESPDAVESVAWPVRAGEQYRIWIFNLGPRASSFSVEHFISAGTGATAAVAPADKSLPGNKSVSDWFVKSGGVQ